MPDLTPAVSSVSPVPAVEEEGEAAPVTATARASWTNVNEMCRTAVRTWPAGITLDADKQITAVVRREMLHQVMPLLREIIDAMDEFESDTGEGFEDVYERLDGHEARVTSALTLVAHDAAANALADYVRIHYTEDEQARALADRLTDSLRAVASALAMMTAPAAEPVEEPVEAATGPQATSVVAFRPSVVPDETA